MQRAEAEIASDLENQKTAEKERRRSALNKQGKSMARPVDLTLSDDEDSFEKAKISMFNRVKQEKAVEDQEGDA